MLITAATMTMMVNEVGGGRLSDDGDSDDDDDCTKHCWTIA